MLNPIWLWGDRGLAARMTRFSLLPASVLYRVTMAVRARAYRWRLLPRNGVDVPVVAVGNLTVGGSGKTPIANWIARYYADQGLQAAIVLRGYGGDEANVHRRLAQSAIVIENPDRVAGAREAKRNGADVVVLDDAFQRLDIMRDLNIVLVSTESSRAVRWTLPAGPWREGIRALRRADLVVVTRKRADRESAERFAHRVERISRRPVVLARLGVTGFTGLLSGEAVPVESLDGARVLAAAGVADPYAFAGQCSEFGAQVRLLPFDDHHEFDDVDMNRMVQAGRRVDYVVITEKDAVKLRSMWPGNAPEPIVASLDVEWEYGRDDLETALDAVVSRVDDLLT
ncbi:MAG: tetraacyldisaccharide 4'-kinase [Gemmatimonadetes bacterium]|nr:tetraacyldisaccharide 4'-kinase [Gemmatimonadota bacterium]